MRILLSNDDGYLAPGLALLARSLARENEITVVAPDRDCSGASNALTLNRPIRAERAENGFWRVAGTPTDCVHLAITGLLEAQPDMIISGINAGRNLGDDVIYSGTMGAAMEGRVLGLPAIAISMADDAPTHYDTAVRAVQRLIDAIGRRQHEIPNDAILNMNVPDREWDAVTGFEVTRLGRRHKAEDAVPAVDPRGRTVYWVGAAGPARDAGPGTDFHAIEQGRISITPIQVDLTRHAALEPLGRWIETLPWR